MFIISHKSTNEFKNFLQKNNFDFIETIDNPNLDPRIADHPDLSIFNLDGENMVIDKSVFVYYQEKLTNINLIAGENVETKYPYDSLYNIYKGTDFYIHNEFTEKNISTYLKNKNIKHYLIKQGYTRCSLVPMGDKVLTSDYGIFKALKDKIDIVLLKEENIPLDGFDNGFLGGTCGFFDDTLIFNGNIEKLNSFDIIRNEANKSGIKLLYPTNSKLLDTGSILFSN
ncbi:hypothetical protein JNO63_08285 [Anaerococcus sp. mt242]|uniref:DUF6873 family GME fold protein n=2 Tax=Anaerococcus TaxID=165779 RepID=UPI0019330C9A|nr:hypothetical protein [Anaerococcus sp. mt242]MBM0047090.1 hypothetical protein [Anaerococcus sp. mt242]